MDSATDKPKLIHLKTKKLFLVIKAILVYPPGLIGIRKYPNFKSRVDIKLIFIIFAKISSVIETGN